MLGPERVCQVTLTHSFCRHKYCFGDSHSQTMILNTCLPYPRWMFLDCSVANLSPSHCALLVLRLPLYASVCSLCVCVCASFASLSLIFVYASVSRMFPPSFSSSCCFSTDCHYSLLHFFIARKWSLLFNLVVCLLHLFYSGFVFCFYTSFRVYSWVSFTFILHSSSFGFIPCFVFLLRIRFFVLFF